VGIRRSQIGRGDIARDANWLRPFLPAIGGDTYRVRVSVDDTTPDYLDAKITSTDGSVVITVANDGADEDLDLSGAVYVAGEIGDALAAVTITAGAGLTGGGDLSASRTINVATADTSMTINADSIQVRLATTSGLQVSSGLMIADTIAGAGLTIASKVLAVGGGDGIDVAADSIAVDVTDIIGTGLTEEATNNIAVDFSVVAAQADLHDTVTLSTAANSNLLSLTGQQIGLDNQSANIVFAGPSTGAAAAPAFRALVDADIPASIARDSEVTTAVSTHAADANAHHNRSHAITSASDHTVTGAALDVVGLTTTNTLGILTPSAAVSTAVSALLKTDSNGRVRVRGLGVNGAPTGNTLYVGGTGTVATLGDGTGAAVAVLNGAAGQVRDMRYQSAGVNRWALRVENTAEGGADAGSDLLVFPYSDAGVIKSAAMTISRASGDVSFSTNATVGGTLYAGTTVTAAVFGDGSGATVVNIDGAAGQVRDVRYQSAGVNRWVFRVNNTAESGSDAGSSLEVRPYNDAGTLQAAAISVTRATGNVDFSAAVTVGGDMTITTNGNQGDRFLMENSNVSGGSVFYDFNQTDRDAGSTGAFELGFYRDANNITQVRMSKEVFEVIIRSGGTYRFPLEVRAQQVILAELPTSNPGIVGALYRSGGTVLIST